MMYLNDVACRPLLLVRSLLMSQIKLQLGVCRSLIGCWLATFPYKWKELLAQGSVWGFGVTLKRIKVFDNNS